MDFSYGYRITDTVQKVLLSLSTFVSPETAFSRELAPCMFTNMTDPEYNIYRWKFQVKNCIT
jgi:hypothetical protein